MTKCRKIPPEIQDLAEQIGDFIQHWGFKRIHGKIWTHIFLSDVPLDAAELIRRLGISKALVSISIRDLLEYEVIFEAGKSPNGTTVFKPNLQLTDVILNVLRSREKRMLSRINAAFRLIQDLSDDEKNGCHLCSKKAKSLGEMIEEAEETLDAILALSSVNLKEWKRLGSADLRI